MSLADTTAIPLKKLSCAPTLGLLTTPQPATHVGIGAAGADCRIAPPRAGLPGLADAPPAVAPARIAQATSTTHAPHRTTPPIPLRSFISAPPQTAGDAPGPTT